MLCKNLGLLSCFLLVALAIGLELLVAVQAQTPEPRAGSEVGHSSSSVSKPIIDTSKRRSFLFKLFGGEDYTETYSVLNRRLMGKPNNVEGDMKTLKQMLKDSEESIRGRFKINVNSFFVKKKIGALKQIIALELTVHEDHRCSMASFEILYKNHAATKGLARRDHKITVQARTGEPRESSKRIVDLVYWYAVNHAIECRPRYPNLFRRQLLEVDADQLNRLRNSLAGYIEQSIDISSQMHDLQKSQGYQEGMEQTTFYGRNGRIWVRFVVDPPKEYLDVSSAAQELYGNIKRLVNVELAQESSAGDSHDKLARCVANSELVPNKIKDVLDHYISEPCASYLEKLRSVFIPADYDEFMFSHTKFTDKDPANEDYYAGWAVYKICEHLAKDENYQTLVKEVAHKAERITKRAAKSNSVGGRSTS